MGLWELMTQYASLVGKGLMPTFIALLDSGVVENDDCCVHRRLLNIRLRKFLPVTYRDVDVPLSCLPYFLSRCCASVASTICFWL